MARRNSIQTPARIARSTASAASAVHSSLATEPFLGPQPVGPGAGHSISRLAIARPQAQLTVSQPGDPMEIEAERTADQVMRMESPEAEDTVADEEETEPGVGVPGAPAISREAASPGSPGAGDSGDAPNGALNLVESTIAGSGQPLDRVTRAEMEPKFGHDFSGVRVHTDSQASRSADSMQAHAYATGNDIVFASGKYAPGSADGKRLLAHELTHVIQQSAAPAVARSAILVQRDGPPTATAPPPTTTPGTNPPPGAPPTADADKDLLDKEKTAFDEVKGRAGYPGVEVLFSNPKSPNEKDNPVKETFSIGDIVPRSTAEGSRKGFDTAGAANAYAATIATAQGVISLQQDNFFFVAKLAPGQHELRVVDRSWSTTEYIVNVILPFSVSISDAVKRSYVYQVTPFNDIMGLAGADGYLFPLNTELDPNIDRTKYQSNPDTAKPPDAQALRDMVGIAPEGTKPEDRPKLPSQVDMTDSQKETFIYSYFRARGLEALQANEDQVDDLANTFKATTPGTANSDPKGVSPEAKAMIDSTRAQGEKFKQILDDEAQIGANLSFMKAQAEYGTTVTVTETDSGGYKRDYEKQVHDWDVGGTEDGKASIKPLSQWIALVQDKQTKVELQKGEIMAQFPLLAQLVAPNTERYMPATSINVAPGKDMYSRPIDPSVPQVYSNNPYKDSLLAKDATPQNDEAIRAEFEKKLDAIRDAIRKTRAEVTGGDSDFLLGLGGLRLRVSADLDRMGDQNQGLKAKLDELLKAKAIKDQVVDIAGMAIQIGLLFVPGGQFLSAATGFAMGANEMNKDLKQWTASQASVTPGGSLADQQAAEDALFSATLQLAVSAIDVGVSVNHALGAIETGPTPRDMQPQKIDEATEVPKKTTSGEAVKVPEKPVKLAPWEAQNLRPQFVEHLQTIGCNAQTRACSEATVLKECGGSWEGVKNGLLRYADANASEKAAGEYFMNQMTVFRKSQDDALLKEAIDAIEAKHGISGMHSTEAVGSTSLTSDLDYSIKGPNAEEVIAEFNSRFRATYGKESGVVFDTNAYTYPTYFEYPITQDPTKPAKTIGIVPLDPAAKETTGGLEAWEKFKKDTLAGAKSPEEQKRLTQLMDEAAAKYKNDLGARLRYVANYQQDVAAHIATCEHYLSEGPEGAAKWEEYKKDLLGKATGEQQEALKRVFAEAESRVHTYQNEVLAKLRELYPNEKFTEADLAEMAHSQDPEKLEKFMRARNRMYEEKLSDLSELKKKYAAATTEAEKEELAAQIQAKQQESLYFASEAYQTSGSILSVVQNTQKAGKAVLNPSYGALVASQSRAAFFEQYGKALAYDADLTGVVKAGKYTKRSGYALMAHPLAGEVAMPGVMNTVDGIEGLKTASNDQIFQFLKGPYPSAATLEDALKLHHTAMAAARDQLAGRMIEISGRPLPDIQLAWEKLGEGDNTAGIMRLLSLLQQASALDDDSGPVGGGSGTTAVSRQIARSARPEHAGEGDLPDRSEELVQSAIAGGGTPLDHSTRADMEPKFGHDFSHVKIHTDVRASQSADAVQAHAYAVGSDIAFASGKYQPGSTDGKRLIAHELTHVVQQSAAPPAVQRVAVPSTTLRQDGPDTLPPTATVSTPLPWEVPPGERDNYPIASWGGIRDTLLWTKIRYYRDFDTLEKANIWASSLGRAAAVFLEKSRYVVYPLEYSAWHHFTYDNIRFDDDRPDCDVSTVQPIQSIVTEDGIAIAPWQMNGDHRPIKYMKAEDHAQGEDPFSARKDVFGQGMGTITVREKFLDQFRAAMRQVAFTTLDKSEQIAEAKQKEMAGGVLPSQDKTKILIVAGQLAALDKEIGKVDRPYPSNPRSMDVEGHQAAEDARQTKLGALMKERSRILVEYPLLGQVDVQKFIDTQSEEKQAGMLGDAAGDVLKNIQTTRNEVLSNDLNLWAVKPIVEATRRGLGIQDEGRNTWINDKVENDREDSVANSRAMIIWQIVLTIAGVAVGGPAGAAFLAGGIGLSAIDAALTTEKYYTDKPAANTDIDQNKSLIPDDMDARHASVVMAWMMLGVSAAMAVPWGRLLQEGTVTADEAAEALAKSSNIDVKALKAAASEQMQVTSGELVEMLAEANAKDASAIAKAEYVTAMTRGLSAANENAGIIVEMSGGSWKSVTTTLKAINSAEANTLLEEMNAWRIQQYDSVEKALGIKLVRTGTVSPLSDMDASVLGANSNEMRVRAEQMLAERLGPDWKSLMDADLFSDPTRMYLLHLVDEKVAGEAIKQAEGRLVGEAELNMLAKMQLDKADQAILQKYSQDFGVPLEKVNERAGLLQAVKADSKQLEAEIDTLHGEFEAAANDPVKQAELAEQIAQKQGLVNASIQGPYMTPGGVLKHVGMRDLAFRQLLTAGRAMSPAMGYMTVLDDLSMCEHVLQDIGEVGLNESNAKALAKYAERLTITAGQFGVDFSKANEARELFDQVSGLLSGARSNPAAVVDNAQKYFKQVAGLPLDAKEAASLAEPVGEYAQAYVKNGFKSLREQIPGLRAAVKEKANEYLGVERATAPTGAGGGGAPGPGAPGGGGATADAVEKQAAAEDVAKTETALTRQEELLDTTPVVAVDTAQAAHPTVERVEIDYGKRLSSAGLAGSQTAANCGVYEGRIPGVAEPVAIKIYPGGQRTKYLKELEYAEVAGRTGKAAKFYGNVPVDGGRYAFAMEKVEGDFPVYSTPAQLAGVTLAEAQAQAAQAASRVTFDTSWDVVEYGKRMLNEGYYFSGEIQGLVTKEGAWKAIDFQGCSRLPIRADFKTQAEFDAAMQNAMKHHASAVTEEIKTLNDIAAENMAKKAASQ